MTSRIYNLERIVRDPVAFTRIFNNIQLFPYQVAPFEAILHSITAQLGESFVVIFSRQSGKDELLANLLVYLFVRLYAAQSSIVCVLPTLDPQARTAMARLDARLDRPWFKSIIHRANNRFYRFGKSICTFASAEPHAHVVGATAHTLLVVNEAQDVDPALYDKKFAPMAASGNATRVFLGTSWTSQTLLARELRLARQKEKMDGRQRTFIVTGEEAGHSNSLYAAFVAREIEKLGRQHPLIRTQYFCEEIDAQAGLFTPGRLALMQPDRPAQPSPQPGRLYAFLIDVAGMDETTPDLEGFHNPGRDSTTLSTVEIDLSTLSTLRSPTYRVVMRRSWTGANHLTVFGQLKALAGAWNPQHILIDASGVGEGLWALLDRSFPERVRPVKFSAQAKSEIGWRFLAAIESGRFHDCSDPRSPLADVVRTQYAACTSEILTGPGKTLRWGVKDGARGPDGELIHDDHILADSLVAELDRLDWQISVDSLLLEGDDPLKRKMEF